MRDVDPLHEPVFSPGPPIRNEPEKPKPEADWKPTATPHIERNERTGELRTHEYFAPQPPRPAIYGVPGLDPMYGCPFDLFLL